MGYQTAVTDSQAVAVLLKTQLQEIGIEVNLEMNDWVKHLDIAKHLEGRRTAPQEPMRV